MAQRKTNRDKYYEDFLSANPSFGDIVNVLSFDNRTIASQRFDPKALEVIDTLNSPINAMKRCRYGQSSNFEFAVKYIPIPQDRFGNKDEDNKKKLENLLKELKGFKNLINHESIVKFYGLCIDNGKVLVCMELMDFTLRDFYTTFLQAQKPFPEDLVGYIVKSTVSALQACQEQGLNHRMIKPSNILFNRIKGEIKLGDYGEARILHDSTSSTFSGTLCYWAPERFSLDYKHDNTIYNIGCNVWSLGITLIEIILGKVPYKEEKITENIVLLKKQTEELQTKNFEHHLDQMSIADSVKGFIQKCLVTPIKKRTYDMIAGTEFYKNIQKSYKEVVKKKVVKKYADQYESEKEALEKRLEQDLKKSKVDHKTPDTNPKKVFEQETFSFNVAKVKEVEKIYTQRRSEIFEGLYELDDRKLAIKKLFFKSYENPQKKKDRFIYEIKVIKKLNNESPFITYFYEYEVKETQGNLYMELMNMNLKELYLAVHKSVEKFPEQLLRCITVSTVNALSYCHAKNIIHCDVKPTNVLVNQHGKIKLTDFDSAIDLDNTKDYDRIGGTMAYWAPDLFLMDDDFNSKSSQVDRKTQARFNPKRDIWSLGMTLAEALIGRLPYLQEGEDPPKGYDVIKYVNKIDYARVFLKRGHSFEDFLECSDFYNQFAADRDYDISIIRFLSACLQFMANIPSLIELQEEDFYRACPKDNDEIYRIAKVQLESLKDALHSFRLTSNTTTEYGSTARTAAATSSTLDGDEDTPNLFQWFSTSTNLKGPEPSSSGRNVAPVLTNEGMEKTFDHKIQTLRLEISNLLYEKILDFRHLNHKENQEILEKYTNLARTLYVTGKYANIPVYRHFSRPKGLAIIINELTYPAPKGKTGTEKRKGSEKDAQNLEELFKVMNFEIYNGSTFVDLRKQAMLKHLETFAKDKRHNKYDSCIVVVMGHGSNGIIYDIDYKPIYIQDILNLFNGENAPGLVGKPKVFISQACRGGNSDYGVPYNDQQEDLSRPDPSSSVEDQFEDVVNEPPKKKLKKPPAPGPKKISIFADFFELYPTVPTMPASRGKQGSMFISTICEVFYEFAHLNDLEEMAIIIKRLVSRRHYTKTDKLTQKKKIKYQQPQLSTTNGARYFMFPCVYI